MPGVTNDMDGSRGLLPAGGTGDLRRIGSSATGRDRAFRPAYAAALRPARRPESPEGDGARPAAEEANRC
jgi:hypothetical protein